QILQTVAEQLFADEDSRLEEIFREADSPDALRDAAVKAIDLEVEFYLRDDMTRRLILAILATPQIAETVKRSVERTMHILLEEARRFFPDMNQEDVAATVQTSVALYLGLGQNAFMQEDPMKRVRLIEEWKRAQGAYVTAIFGMSK
ncbi:hypothetical protein DK058_25980, partial [Salmonella enterica subsp. enterica serovar Typhi]|nr:hypothetical protein [Salmonella enterica subsp. enterica serovar Typhi]